MVLSLSVLGCASSPTRTTRDLSQEDDGAGSSRPVGGANDGGPAGPSANAGPFQAEEQTTKGPPQIVITNGTEEIVNVEFEGPSASKMSITPGDTQAFTSTAGSYSITLSDPAGARAETTLADIAIDDGWIYTWVIRMKSSE